MTELDSTAFDRTECRIASAIRSGAWQRFWCELNRRQKLTTHVVVERYGDVQITHCPRGGFLVRGPMISSWAPDYGEALARFKVRADAVANPPIPKFPEWELIEREEAGAWKYQPDDYIRIRVLEEENKRLRAGYP